MTPACGPHFILKQPSTTVHLTVATFAVGAPRHARYPSHPPNGRLHLNQAQASGKRKPQIYAALRRSVMSPTYICRWGRQPSPYMQIVLTIVMLSKRQPHMESINATFLLCCVCIFFVWYLHETLHGNPTQSAALQCIRLQGQCVVKL